MVGDVLVSRRDGDTRLSLELTSPVVATGVFDEATRTLTVSLPGVIGTNLAGKFPPLALIERFDVQGDGRNAPLRIVLQVVRDVRPDLSALAKTPTKRVTIAFTAAAGAESAADEQLLASEGTFIGEGLQYQCHRYRAADGAGSDVHVLRYALQSPEFALGLRLGQETILGRERMSSMATNARAVAAVNASFFAGNGEPLGLVSTGRNLLSVPIFRRSCFGIFDGKLALLGNPGFSGKLETDFGEFWLAGINQSGSGATGKVLVYTPEFGATTHTKGKGLEMAISNGRVVALQESDSPIPPDGFVVGLRGTPPEAMRNVKFWNQVRYRWGLTPPWDVSDFAVGGGPRLLTDGEITVTWQEEHFTKSFAETRAPRTAVGVAGNGDIVLVVADGRDGPRNAGLSLDELASVMRRFGCRDACNLDGGGSSEMWIQGKIVNRPSDGRERPISSALVLTRRQGATFAGVRRQPDAIQGT